MGTGCAEHFHSEGGVAEGRVSRGLMMKRLFLSGTAAWVILCSLD